MCRNDCHYRLVDDELSSAREAATPRRVLLFPNPPHRMEQVALAEQPTHSTLLIGDTSCHGSREACDRLAKQGPLRCVDSIDEAAREIADGTTGFELIVLAASYPGQFRASEVDALRRLAPIARIVSVMGSWCEGEPRSGSPIAAVPRVYWHQLAGRLRKRRGDRNRVGDPFDTSPLTTTELEAVECDAWTSVPVVGGLLVIQSDDRVTGDCLADVCRTMGAATAVVNSRRQPQRITKANAGIFDCRTFHDSEWIALGRFVELIRPAPVVVLGNFPRHQNVSRARDCGATEILSKPFRTADLYATLAMLTPPSASDGRGHDYQVEAA